MAEALNIRRCWFHKDHYDIPKRRVDEIKSKCTVVSSKEIINMVRGSAWGRRLPVTQEMTRSLLVRTASLVTCQSTSSESLRHRPY